MDASNIPEDIRAVCQSITEQFSPESIYLFSNKRGGIGKSAGFKLCVILDCNDMEVVERKIYLDIDCDVPFDVVLYSPETWRELLTRKGSLAERIQKTGVLVYG